MKLFSSLRSAIHNSAIYNKVLGKPKGIVGNYLRRKCDGIPEERRLLVVAVMSALFVLTAFIVFGHACYRIGRGHTLTEQMEIRHIEGLDLPVPDNSDSLMMDLNEISYDFSGFENENQ